MEIMSYAFDGIPLLSLDGDFDHASVSSFSEKAREALGETGSRLLLQLTDCPFIDSGGIGCLLTSLRQVRPTGWLGVVAPSPEVLHLLQMVGLTIDPGFRVFAGLDEVPAVLSEPATAR